tara:strand:- start:51 stop:383 length:333 start_codon:yes stop_codon:yes gene_type:complete
MEVIQNFKDVTPEVINQLKAKHGKSLTQATVIVEGEEYNYILKKPNRNVMEAIGKPAAENDIAKVNKIFIANCVVAGDMSALEDDGAVYAEVLKLITELTSKVESSLKKL